MPERSIEVFEYNAFAPEPFGGNPAGVVLEAEGLSGDEMLRIARQINLSETAFLTAPSSADADVRLRWFTPTREVTLCGHATIAAFVAAADHGDLAPSGPSPRELRVETASGVLRIAVAPATDPKLDERHGGGYRVSMQLPVPRLSRLELDARTFAGSCGVRSDRLIGGPWLKTDLDYWYIPVQDLDVLRSLSLDVGALAGLDPEAAFAFYTEDTVSADAHWHLRFFAPFHGVPEDPVTGSAQGPMGVIRLEHLRPATGDGWFEFVGEQGGSRELYGRVDVRVQREGGAVSDVEIGGTAVPMLQGRLWL